MATGVPTRASFLENYPEFARGAPGLVDAKLAEAALRTNAVTMGTKTTAAVMLRAAILLLKSPYGRELRVENPEQLKTWEGELRGLQRQRTVGLGVT